MALTKSQRQSHTNTSSACIPVVNQINHKNGKKGEYSKPRQGCSKAKKALMKHHKLESFNGNNEKVHTCHLCKNDSSAPNGFVCKNPEHLYFGSHSENEMDKPPEVRKRGGSIGGSKHKSPNGSKQAIANGNHSFQQKRTCIYCGYVSSPAVIGRLHNDRCKHKP